MNSFAVKGYRLLTGLTGLGSPAILLQALFLHGMRHAAPGGLAQVMRLALTQRKKAFSFLSTVGVVAGLDHPHAVLEAEDGPSLCAEHPGDGGYAVG